jgi:thiamine-phosphate pyrophosphorylase
VDAAQGGADYVAFGSFHSSETKPGAVHAPVALLGEARAALSIPLCAIGGIAADNGGELLRSGADLLAVIRGVFAAADVEAAARGYARLFEP